MLRDCAWTLRPRRAGQLARAWWWYGRARRGQGDGERRATKDGTREVTCIIEAILLCGGRVYPAALGYGLRGIVSKPTPPRFPATSSSGCNRIHTLICAAHPAETHDVHRPLAVDKSPSDSDRQRRRGLSRGWLAVAAQRVGSHQRARPLVITVIITSSVHEQADGTPRRSWTCVADSDARCLWTLRTRQLGPIVSTSFSCPANHDSRHTVLYAAIWQTVYAWNAKFKPTRGILRSRLWILDIVLRKHGLPCLSWTLCRVTHRQCEWGKLRVLDVSHIALRNAARMLTYHYPVPWTAIPSFRLHHAQAPRVQI